MKKTVVFVASPNALRFSHKMVKSLIRYDHDVVPVGFREGSICDIPIQTNFPVVKNVDTVSLYLNPVKQSEFYDYIISLEPKRVIFNPGTYNPEFVNLLRKNNIEAVIDCALVMLSKGIY